MSKKLHLDSEYRNRYIEFHKSDGTIQDSRHINWREVEWNKVVKIVAHLNGNKHEIKNSYKNFKFFMNFRWGGREWIKENGRLVPKEIRIWTIGWTDGEMCYLWDIDFSTGKKVNYYKEKLKVFKGHIHSNYLLEYKHLFNEKEWETKYINLT